MENIKNLFDRHFTKELENQEKTMTVYDLFDWEKRDILIKNHKTGAIILDMKNLEFPKHYSLNASNIIADKYFRKRIELPDGHIEHETSMRQVADRMVGFWADALKSEGLIKTDSEYQIFYDEVVFALLSQMWAPNSPQWFNTGIKRNYGLAGTSDQNYYYDPLTKTVKESEDRYGRTQASACFILSIEDKLLGEHSITEQFQSETKLFKGGSGVGTNFSPLRAVNEQLSSGGHSSGMMSFLLGLDRNAGAIKSGGTTRRAAKMVIVDIDHPEIENFINWKVKEENKIRALGIMGYDTSMDGEAYQTVSGQNSNNSVRLNEEFMSKLAQAQNANNTKNVTIELKGRKDDSVNRNVNVLDLWENLNNATWTCGDPGIQFDDRFNIWNTCPLGEDGDRKAKHNRINATNPCSEYAFLDDTACNLASINVYSFYDPETNYFNNEAYCHVIRLIQLILESSIYQGQYPTKDVARKSYLFRTTGMGIANVASLLLAATIPYDSDEGRTLVATLAGIITGEAYKTSALIAQEIGPFEKYDLNKEYMLHVLKNHARVAGSIPYAKLEDELKYFPNIINHDTLNKINFKSLGIQLKRSWTDAIALGEKHGYRNAQVSVIAPTGTISFAMDCASTSIEPFFNHITTKKLVTGSIIEMINPVVPMALKKLKYNEKEIEELLEYMLERDNAGNIIHTSFKAAPSLKDEHRKIFETANEISAEGHVLMVSYITSLISGSVSKTVNLPNSATIEDVKKIHMLAYQTGAKSIAVYRDRCKVMQPLQTNLNETSIDQFDLNKLSHQALLELVDELRHKKTNRVKPNAIRDSRTHSSKIGDVELYTTIGYYDSGELSEVFISTDKDGTVVKGLLASLSKCLSNMLQDGITPSRISKILKGQKYEPSGFVERHPYIKFAESISDLIGKIIDMEIGQYDGLQIKPDLTFPKSAKYKSSVTLQKEKDQSLVYTPDAIKEMISNGSRIDYSKICPHCGGKLIVNGTCHVCVECGETTGCS